MNFDMMTFPCCDCPAEKAQIMLVGAPYCTAPGEGNGPAAIRRDSARMSPFSPYQGRDLGRCSVRDTGDLALDCCTREEALKALEDRVYGLLGDRKLPVVLGGDRCLTLAGIRALARLYPGLQVIQFGAHADLGPGAAMEQCYALLGERKLHQFCIRSGTRAEFAFARRHTELHPYDFGWLNPAVCRLTEKDTPVYFSLCLDCLDPSELPGVRDPEAGGVSFRELLGAIRKVCQARVVGADLTGLAPGLDPTGISASAARQVLRELLIALSPED